MNKDEEEFIIDETIPEPELPGEPGDSIAEDTAISSARDTTKKTKSWLGSAINNIYHFFNGDFLTKENFAKQVPFILYIILLMMILIASSYKVENTNTQIRNLTKKIEQYHTEYIYLKAAITKETKQSSLVKKLQYRGIKESKEPMKKIEIVKPVEE